MPPRGPAAARTGARIAVRVAAGAVGLACLGPRIVAAAASAADGGGGPIALPWLVGAGLLASLAALGVAIARRRPRPVVGAAPDPTRASPATVSATERTVLLDPVDAETHAAMDRLSATVRSHDLGGGPDEPAPGHRGNAAPARRPPERDDVVAEIGPPPRSLTGTELELAPRTELREQVRIVTAHNAKLHKVVIAQQASLESARHSIAHHRSVAREAKEETRVAIEHKRVAVKLARRERAERVRIADAHVRSEAALSNAMALLGSMGDGRDADADAREATDPGADDAPRRFRSVDRGRR